ncbi:DoxX family protein [Emticicia sp. CRIBPO]|uniref:DoxX family protein n=1 Tax=Emticicia sp. CRIBPO TaxID=2683258 RepID=UPI0014135100|nr:DoxX family protein [Emticicia sp. CRIBPO]NBA86750.1 DoxX family protein [Emticicia sp. CRIBPO]
MNISSEIGRVYRQLKENRWMLYFTVFCRIALAAGFLPSGFVKIMGERFTSLSVNHPMGNYLEALHHTGYYYTFIGVLQMTAAVLLLIPRTALLGAVLYFPVILNICILSFAVRFDGSLLTAPMMVLANLYLLCWDYDRLRFILPFKAGSDTTTKKVLSNKFPTVFFGSVFLTMVVLGVTVYNVYELRPRNTPGECDSQCKDSRNPEACRQFCDCIHQQGQPFNKCLDAYNSSIEKGTVRLK